MVGAPGLEGEVEQGTQTDIIAILIICGLTHEDLLVVGGVVWAVERVLHVEISFVGIAVVHGSQHAEDASAFHFPAPIVAEVQLQVSNGFLVFHCPVVVQSVVQDVHGRVFGTFLVWIGI